jgi:hypothetical protein
MATRKQAPKVHFSQEIFDAICARIAAGGDNSSLVKICAEPGMPTRQTFNEWRKRTPELEAQYDRACEDRKDTFFDELIQIADTETDPQRARNRMDARKWAWARMDRKRFGDRVDSEITGKDGSPLSIEIVRFGSGNDKDPAS